jgi:putative nucleotidyltransferase with HDIG domain
LSNSIRILLVEDDDLFRATILRSLVKKQFSVSEASNGKIAREMLLQQTFDLVLSDIQMPHFSGLDLLEWIKKKQPLPVILMTGFSQALETQKAHEAGADDFLAKPFKEADLMEVVRRHTGVVEEASPPPAPVDLDKDFCKVSVEEFLSAKETLHNIYIRISKYKYIKIAHKGGKISEERIKAYKDKGVHFVFVAKEDFARIVGFNLKVARAVSQSSLAVDKKINFMKHTGELILENAFVQGVNTELFNEAKDFIETSMDILTEDEELFTILDILSTHADFLYAHSLGVSSFSVMIGRELGWHSGPVLFRLTMGGLFHDIGKKEISKETLEKSRPLLTQAERTIIETHPTRGKEILEALKSIPTEVIEIAYQHHEDPIGLGFPRGIGKREIHPLAKVVQVANIFCEYAVKSRADVEPMIATDAIATMERLKSDRMDKEAFAALKRIFK